MRVIPSAAVAAGLAIALALTPSGQHAPVDVVAVTGLASACRQLSVGEAQRPMRWYTPRDAAQRERLDGWCRSVGAPVLVTGPAATAAPPDRLTIVSWNTHVGGARLTKFVGDLRSGVFSDGEPVRHFVMLLQEVYRADAAIPPTPAAVDAPRRIDGGVPDHERESILDVAARLQLWVYYVPSMRNGGRPDAERLPEDRGNAIVSTWPLEDLAAAELPMLVQRRVAGLATVRIPTPDGPRRIRFLTAHLDATVGWKRVWLIGAARHRARQAETLVATLAAESDASDAIVVGGDFNTSSGGTSEKAYTIMRDAFPQSPPPSGSMTFPSWHWRLDFFFMRLRATWTAKYVVAASRAYGSDHYPLVGVLQIAPRAHPAVSDRPVPSARAD